MMEMGVSAAEYYGEYDSDEAEIMAAEAPTREEEKADEIRLDAEDDARRTAEETSDEGWVNGDDDGCEAVFVDGSYTDCGCGDCAERTEERRQHAFEAGHSSDEMGYWT